MAANGDYQQLPIQDIVTRTTSSKEKPKPPQTDVVQAQKAHELNHAPNLGHPEEHHLENPNLPHNHEARHIDLSTIYENRQVLHRVRTAMFWINSVFWAAGSFGNDGWMWFPYRIRFMTFWGLTLVNAYLFWVIMFFPKHRWLNSGTIRFQQGVLFIQTLIVIVYWSILAPSSSKKISILGYYDHICPFLFMVHEMIVTYGTYNFKGELLGLGIYALYSAWNMILAFGFDIVVYKTKYTDPHHWETLVAMPIALLLSFLIGRLCTQVKNQTVRKLHERRVRLLEKKEDDIVEQMAKEKI